MSVFHEDSMSRRSNSIRIALVAASALALVTACSAPAADPHAAHAAQAASADVVVQPTAAASGRVSIYDLRGEWTDQAGRTARLGEMPRRPLTVVTMLYTNCTVSCPRILVDLKRIEAGLPADRLDDVRFVIASIDPARDTPVRLAGWAQDVRLDTARFTLITAPDANSPRPCGCATSASRTASSDTATASSYSTPTARSSIGRRGSVPAPTRPSRCSQARAASRGPARDTEAADAGGRGCVYSAAVC